MIERVAYLSIHTSPLLQPGTGSAGGMNVYIHELAQTMARRGVAVTVFTRRTDPDAVEMVEVEPAYRVVHIEAGEARPVPTEQLHEVVGEFAEGVIKWTYVEGSDFDLVHSHYWLSGWAGVLVKEALGIPLANSFHTLGRVKDATRRPDDPPAGLLRIATETDVIARSDCVVASTPAEAEDLLEHYRANPERLCVSPPGIDHGVFSPGSKRAARGGLGLGEEPVLLFVGRIQPLKGLDVAVRAHRLLLDRFPGIRLVVTGGPSGPGGVAELEHVNRLISTLGTGNLVEMLPPQPHGDLAHLYRAADVLLVPSRSESFGLVAAEAQACGLPVVAAAVGGLRFAVDDGESGFLVEGWDPSDHAAAAARIIADPDLAAALAQGALRHSATFSWDATADRLLELYSGITGR